MTTIRLFSLVALASVAVGSLSGCTPVGVAAGAGAMVGTAAASEGGLQAAASDTRIRAEINDLWFKYNVDTFRKLNMTVDQGRVLVTGVVQNPEDRVEAVRLAWQPKGVKQVINEVRVDKSEGVPGYIRDSWISTRLRTALMFDANVQSINYSIDTVGGIVYLMGVAQNKRELDRVIEVARTIPHVKQVVSYVKMAGEETLDQGASAEPAASGMANEPAWTPAGNAGDAGASVGAAPVGSVTAEPLQ